MANNPSLNRRSRKSSGRVLLPGLGARTLSRQGTDDQNSSREIEGGYFNRHGQHGAANNAPGGLNNTAGPSNSALVHHSPALSDTDEYPGAASSSTVQGQENRDVSTYNSGATTSFDADAEMQTFLATGPIVVCISTERELPSSTPASPAFLHGMNSNTIGASHWYGTVLQAIREFTFSITSTTDLHFLADMFASASHPNLFAEVTKISFPKLFWFSGVMNNRKHNPNFLMTASLPSLKEISFTLHTAGMTTSCFGEKMMIQLERTDPARAKERRMLTLQELVLKYEFNGLFACQSVRTIRISWIDCAKIAHFTRVGEAVSAMNQIHAFLVDGFRQHGLKVAVELRRIG